MPELVCSDGAAEIVVVENKISSVSTAYWLSGEGNGWSGATIDLSKLDTSNVNNMQEMFNLFFDAELIRLDKWDASNVTDMSGMFIETSAGYTAENPLDLSGWNVSKVTDYKWFIDEIDPEGSIIPPNFG